MNVKDNIYMQPYAEDDKLLNEWVDEIERGMNIDLFESQEDWLYMSGELGKGYFPQFKNEEAVYDAFKKAFDNRIGWLFGYLYLKMIMKYRLSNINLGEDMEWYLRQEMGDEEFEEWETAAKEAILEEYRSIIKDEDKLKDMFAMNWKDWEE